MIKRFIITNAIRLFAIFPPLIVLTEALSVNVWVAGGVWGLSISLYVVAEAFLKGLEENGL